MQLVAARGSTAKISAAAAVEPQEERQVFEVMVRGSDTVAGVGQAQAGVAARTWRKPLDPLV